MKRLITLFTILLSTSVAHADEPATPCATKVFVDKIAESAQDADPYADETIVQKWIHNIFADKDTLAAVLACPEIASVPDDETITFTPIQFNFDNGRELLINYETQPKLLKQKIALAGKRRLPTSDPNPRIGDINDDAMWTNTDPAWYAIMVTQAGALRDFVGPDKNNTISLQYINDHIDELYPNAILNGGACTSRSAITGDKLAINQAADITTGDDSQDYYVAGDINLEWIGYAELAGEIIISVLTMGGGAVISGLTKTARIADVISDLAPALKALSELPDVAKYISKTDDIADLTKRIDKLKELGDHADDIKDLQKQLDTAKDEIKQLEKIGDVKKYKETSKALDDMYELLDNMGTLDKTIGKTYQKMGGLRKAYNAAKKTPGATKYRQAIVRQRRAQQQLDNLNDAYKTMKETGHLTPDTKRINNIINSLEKQIAKKQSKLGNQKLSKKARKQLNQEIQDLQKQVKNQNAKKTPKKLNNKEQEKALKELEQQIKKNEDNLKKATQEIDDLEKSTDKDIAKQIDDYKKTSKDYSDVVNAGQALKAAKTARYMKQRGNVLTRAIKGSRVLRGAKAFRSVFKGGDKISKAAKLGRTGSLATRTKDWLFHSSLAAAGSLAKFEAQAGFWYTIINFGAEMYDFTSTTTGEYTNNIEFSPLLLLSADDIDGQGNVVNYGMWLMWLGDTTSAADDDAAFLMANDFAAKFHEDLMDVQNGTNSPCDVDIYVVRPVLRNPGEEDGQIYYLIMNDVPWTTNLN